MENEIIGILTQAAKKGGQIVLSYYKKNLTVTEKSSRRDLLTQADLESQKIIVETLTKLMVKNSIDKNEIGFICEENFSKKGKYTFIIDPLDGTSSFVEQTESFTVSIGYKIDDEIIAGIIYLPVKNIIYFAKKNEGTYKIEHDKKIKLVIEERKLIDSLLCFNTSSDVEMSKKILKKIISIIPYVYRVRENPCISFNLIRLIENQYQVVINGRAKLWDIAAAKLIVEEAGGKITNWNWEEFNYNYDDDKIFYPIIASHPNLIPEIAKHFYE